MSWLQAIAYLFASFSFGWFWGFVWQRTVRMWDNFTS